MNKWKCVMTAGITAFFDGCMLRSDHWCTGSEEREDAIYWSGSGNCTMLDRTACGGRTIYQVAGEKTPGTGGTDKLLKNADELDK